MRLVVVVLLLGGCVAAEEAYRYVVEGVLPASKTLNIESVVAACEWLGQAVSEGTIATATALAAAGRVVDLGCCNESAGALLNNVALQCGALYGGSADCERGAVFARAVETAPATAAIALNYAYFLEQRDKPREAALVLSRARETSSAIGLRIAAASLCPPHASTSLELKSRYEKLLGRLEALAVELEGAPLSQEAASLVGFLPIAWPYLGYAYEPLASRLARIYVAASAPLNARPRPANAALRLLVVAELGRNTSPGLLFEAVFEGLCERLDVFLAAPRDLSTPFVDRARRLAHAVVDLTPEDIVAAQPDALLFLAVGLSPRTYALAAARLAPVQISFGHGHPITSGLVDTIDYFVSSLAFESDAHEPFLAEEREQSATYDLAAERAAGLSAGALESSWEVGPRCRNGIQRYTEQLVLFDSRTIGMRPPPLAVRPATLPERPRFACLQHSKKFHPDFDDVLLLLLREVPQATIIVLEGARTHLPRWRSRGLDVSRFHFVPRSSRETILGLVQASDAFLDTFPWGAGLTLLEALAVCTPPVVLPARTGVLQLAKGHLEAVDLDRHLVAANVSHYVAISKRIALDPAFRAYLRHKACLAADALFDANAAVDEWEAFIRRAVAQF